MNNILARPIGKMPKIMDKVRKFILDKEPHELSFSEVIDRATLRVCKHCKKCTKCWVENFNSTHNALSTLKSSLTEFGAILDEDFPKHFVERCHKVNLLKNQINGLHAKKSKKHRGNFMPRSKNNVLYLYEFIPEIESKLYKEFLDKNISVSSIIVVQNSHKHLEISLNIRASHPAEEILSICQAACGRKMRILELTQSDEARIRMRIVQRASFDLEIGVCKESKNGESECGDAYSFTKISDNKTVITVSDGCGHGHVAAKYSEITVELVKKFLAAGVPKNKAIELVNSVLLLGKNTEKFATADIAIFDSYNGYLEILKLGANSSYIIKQNGRKLERISSSSLPVGIFTKTDIDNYNTELVAGDYVIMLSDGIENPNSPWLEDFLSNHALKHAAVQTIANEIIHEATLRHDVDDDKLVVVAKVSSV